MRVSEEQQTKLVFWEALEASTKTCLPRYSWIISSYWSERQTKTETAKLTTATTILCWQFQTGLKRTLASNRNKNRHKKKRKRQTDRADNCFGSGGRGGERDWYAPLPSPLSSLIFCSFSLFSCAVAVRILFNINTHTSKRFTFCFRHYIVAISLKKNDWRSVKLSVQ